MTVLPLSFAPCLPPFYSLLVFMCTLVRMHVNQEINEGPCRCAAFSFCTTPRSRCLDMDPWCALSLHTCTRTRAYTRSCTHTERDISDMYVCVCPQLSCMHAGMSDEAEVVIPSGGLAWSMDGFIPKTDNDDDDDDDWTAGTRNHVCVCVCTRASVSSSSIVILIIARSGHTHIHADDHM